MNEMSKRAVTRYGPPSARRLAPMFLAGLVLFFVPFRAGAERETVLKQIALPHNYYYREMYLPQLTSGPSSPSWSPDGKQLVFSMQGSLWVQAPGTLAARQLTAGPGYDYQPDWSPDGKLVVFARYLDDAVELHLLELASGEVSMLTRGGDVNIDPRWSPDGERIAWVSTRDSGRFHIRVGSIRKGVLEGSRLQEERSSRTVRYYYSEYDHELSPAWSPDGKELVFVANTESAYGSGGLWRKRVNRSSPPVLVRSEETSWKAQPDWSPDGRRVIWSSYQGRQWHQLWITTSAGGGDPIALGYGEFDITEARWSPDGRQLAFISNQPGKSGLWIQDMTGGRRTQLEQKSRTYLQAMGELKLLVVDGAGAPLPARVSVRGSDGRHYGPDTAWLHGDDAFDRSVQSSETHYFHAAPGDTVSLPAGRAEVTVWHGMEHAIETLEVDIRPGQVEPVTVAMRPLALPDGWAGRWQSGDVHVHMNYGGAYRNTPARLVKQAEAEDLDFVFNLIVNKEQRIPDIEYFQAGPDPASNERVVLRHDQEFHTGYWGHLGLLGLSEHYLLPDYSAYPNTGLASPFPDNATVAGLTRRQGGLVGYVHPFDAAPDPALDNYLTNALPVDVALGKVDYYEVSGFSDYLETQKVWYRLLNCGFRLPAAGGTDAMANFASLRGPVGLNRVYVLAEPTGSETAATGPADRLARWLQGLRAGRTMATNGPLLGLEVEGLAPGSELRLHADALDLRLSGFLRSNVPVDHLEIVFNGEVVLQLDRGEHGTSADFSQLLRVDRSGWLLLRAWNDDPSLHVFDRYPFATTNPVFIEVAGQAVRSQTDADYFMAWIERLRAHTLDNEDYNTAAEKEQVLAHIDAALAEFARRR